jgi:3'-5' exoribonuclease
MKYINTLREGENIREIYFCKNCQSAVTKNGKEYLRVTVGDKTGNLDGMIWDPSDGGIENFEKNDYIEIAAEVRNFNGALQLNIKRVRKLRDGEYDPAEYMPVSRYTIDEMFAELMGYIGEIKEPHLKRLLLDLFENDRAFVSDFKKSSAAKSVHHGFMGGLLEHTLAVTRMCRFLADSYSYLNRDLLVCAAICHDIGKVKELTAFPENDYSDSGQLIGHIVLGYEMVSQLGAKQEDFPPKLLRELLHCILAHHGELEFGSPKKPALAEAIALSFADNTDAKLETMREAQENTAVMENGWLGFNKYLDSNIRKTSQPEE